MAAEFREYELGQHKGFTFLDTRGILCELEDDNDRSRERIRLGLRDVKLMLLDREAAAGLIEKLRVFVETGKL